MIDLEDIQKAYFTHEAARILNLGESTLRKYCIELEQNGYTFIKGSMDSRAFTDLDLEALNYFVHLYKSKKHTRKEAALLTVKKFKTEGGNEGTTPIPKDESRSNNNLEQMMKELLEHTKKQEEFNKALLQRLEVQEKYIKESLDKRDQILLETIRSAQEEKAAALEKKKTPWIKRIFKSE
jgi:hemerythrin-like domain-containing protein